jgi:hypothetical protein
MKLEEMKCILCARGEEEGAHLFIRCKLVKDLWEELQMPDI